MSIIKIPHEQLTPQALQGLIEEFVSRDGTDYGEFEVSLETKIFQVLNQIRSRKAVIVFDQESDSCTVVRSDDPGLKEIQ